MKRNDFDRIAPIYDALAGLVFGRKLKRAQSSFLPKIPDNASVLVIGGGTGRILEHIPAKGVEIDYVEYSTNMIKRSIKRDFDGHLLRFIHGTYTDIPEKSTYDVIITQFFLDVFAPDELPIVIEKLRSHLDQDGFWICADFQETGKRGHRFLLNIMHRFFRITTRLTSSEIQNFDKVLNESGFSMEEEQLFSHGLIFSRLYRFS